MHHDARHAHNMTCCMRVSGKLGDGRLFGGKNEQRTGGLDAFSAVEVGTKDIGLIRSSHPRPLTGRCIETGLKISLKELQKPLTG